MRVGAMLPDHTGISEDLDMGKIVAFDLDKLPAANLGTAPKHAPAELDAYIKVLTTGKAAGDGEDYATKKEATAAAASVKRGLKKYSAETSVAMRVWDVNGVWHFALRPFTPPTPKTTE